MTAHEELVRRLEIARPGAEWTLRGPTYDTLEWLDKTQSKPTEAELAAVVLTDPAPAVSEVDRLRATLATVTERLAAIEQVTVVHDQA